MITKRMRLCEMGKWAISHMPFELGYVTNLVTLAISEHSLGILCQSGICTLQGTSRGFKHECWLKLMANPALLLIG
jgi:hypothetical protein